MAMLKTEDFVDLSAASSYKKSVVASSRASIAISVVLLGDAGVGKTTILNVFREEPFVSDQKRTTHLNHEFREMSFQGQNFYMKIWDTAGGNTHSHEPFRFQLKDIQYIIAVYDITRQETLDTAEQCIDKHLHEMFKGVIKERKANIVLVGNKTDQEQHRQVTSKTGQELANKLGASFIECSALNNSNIEVIFRISVRERFKRLGKMVIWWKK